MTWTCRGCGQSPCANPSFCAVCDRAEKQHPRRQTPRDLRNRPTSKPLVEALAYQLRGGVIALKELSAQRRIAELDEAQAKDIAERLTKWRWSKLALNAPRTERLPVSGEPGTVPPWEPAQIKMFVDLWSKTHRVERN
jgi:hypothetical protein